MKTYEITIKEDEGDGKYTGGTTLLLKTEMEHIFNVVIKSYISSLYCPIVCMGKNTVELETEYDDNIYNLPECDCSKITHFFGEHAIDVYGEVKITTKLTFVTISSEKGGDEFPKIVAVGYNEQIAKAEALNALRYACSTDFSCPCYCKAGTIATYFEAEGIEMNSTDDEEEIAEKNDWEYACVFEFEGRKYALPNNYNEYQNGGSYSSSEIRNLENWDEVK